MSREAFVLIKGGFFLCCVVIDGTGFGTQIGNIVVNIGASTCSLTSVISTQIVCNVPAGVAGAAAGGFFASRACSICFAKISTVVL